MLPIKRIMLLAMVCLFVVAACDSPGAANQSGPTAQPNLADADTAARTFLDAWVKNDYQAMYRLLSPKSQLMSLKDFTDLYQKVETTLRPGEGTKSHAILADKSERQGTTAVIRYNMKFASGALGEFTDENRIMRLILAQGGWRIAWSERDIFEGMSSDATLILLRVQGKRGSIFDRNGKPIAEDRTPNISVRLLTRKYPTGKAEDCFVKLSEVFRVRYADLVTDYLQFTGQDYGFTVGHMKPEDLDPIKAELDAACFLEYRGPQVTRFYYGNGLAPQTIGYTGTVQKEQLEQNPQYSEGMIVGQAGLESRWDQALGGESGAQLVINTSDGVQVRVIHTKGALPGQDMTLTIDRELQLEVEKALSGAYAYANWGKISLFDKTYKPDHGAAAVVLNVNTGEVLAMASYPTIDPDAYLLTTTFDTPDTQQKYLNQKANRNRATQELYALGSVFKIVSMAAAADTGTFNLNQVVTCNGTFPDPEIQGGLRKDWIYLDKYVEQKFHGPITLIQALTSSCDIYFWEIARKLNGIDADLFRKYGNQMGLGVKTGIDLVEETGLIPDTTSKFKQTGQRWGVGDSLNTVIGQGNVLVTPIQVARMMMGVANGGQLYRPYLVQKVGAPGQAATYTAMPAPPDDMKIDSKVLKGIQDGLCAVVRYKVMPGTKEQQYGTAQYVFYNWDFAKINICGKTGTAQTGGAYPNGWFAAYAGKTGQPPDIAIVVIVEHSREGSETAGPIVRRIIEAYYGLQKEPWPEFWTYDYEVMENPDASDGGGPRRRP
jgi:cell division protein FtsI/penicillin-binding protein 2